VSSGYLFLSAVLYRILGNFSFQPVYYIHVSTPVVPKNKSASNLPEKLMLNDDPTRASQKIIDDRPSFSSKDCIVFKGLGAKSSRELRGNQKQ
jgi:hypothetical protein